MRAAARIRACAVQGQVAGLIASLPNLLVTVAGNLFERAALSAIRLLDLDFPESFVRALRGAQCGVAGTRALMSAAKVPMIGTIIKPSIGLTADETAALEMFKQV